jgi:hypothetical protein
MFDLLFKHELVGTLYSESIFEVIRHGTLGTVTRLLQQYPIRDDEFSLAMINAAMRVNYEDVVKMVFTLITVQNHKSEAISTLIKLKRINILRDLLETKQIIPNSHLLSEAIENKSASIVRLLLQHGVQVTESDIQSSRQLCQPEIFRLLKTHQN